jgi:predicted nucleic acid-binding protein
MSPAKPNCAIDTNIFIYIHDNSSPSKQQLAQNLLDNLVTTSNLIISTQVLQELANALESKIGLHSDKVCTILDDYSVLKIAPVSLPIIKTAVELNAAHQIPFYDALILSAAEHNHCDILYTEDFQHNQLIHGVKIINPFI